MSGIFITGTPKGYQHLAPTAAGGLTVPAGAKQALISTGVAAVSFRDDGVAPTTAAGGGVTLPAGTVLLYAGNLAAIQFISATGLVDVAFYG